MADRHDPVEVHASKINGRGVFAKNAVRQGSVILAIDDSDVVDPNDPEQAKLIGAEPNHCDYLPDGTITRMRQPEVFINHSCDPNVFVLSVGGRRFVSAMKDIVPGEELVFDYSIGAVDGDWMDCRCGTERCRGRHKVDFFALPVDTQLRYLPYLDSDFVRINAGRLLSLLLKVVQRGGA